MADFLLFDDFISSQVLIVFYYFGAVVMPLLLWWSRRYLIQRFALMGWLNEQQGQMFRQLSRSDQIKLILAILLMFLCLQLGWRMMFEAMIGYFQMHDYLQLLSQSAGY